MNVKLAAAVIALMVFGSAETQAQCNPTDFMVKDTTSTVWTEQLKLAFILSSTKEQYESVRKIGD